MFDSEDLYNTLLLTSHLDHEPIGGRSNQEEGQEECLVSVLLSAVRTTALKRCYEGSSLKRDRTTTFTSCSDQRAGVRKPKGGPSYRSPGGGPIISQEEGKRTERLEGGQKGSND